MILCSKCKNPTSERTIASWMTQGIYCDPSHPTVFCQEELCPICKSELINQLQFAVKGFMRDRPLLTKEELQSAGELLKQACDLLVYWQTHNNAGFGLRMTAFEDQFSTRHGGELIERLQKPGAMTVDHEKALEKQPHMEDLHGD